MNFMAKSKVEKFQSQVKRDLKNLADKKYQKFHSNLCPGISNILGVRVPAIRNYAKEFENKFSDFSYRDIDNEFYEEIMLQGILLGMETKEKKKIDFKKNIEELEWFIPKIDNWAVCDICVSSLKFIGRNLDEYWNFIRDCAYKTGEFEKRFAYVVMLNYYLKDDYIDEVLKILTEENSEDYYVVMAVAWGLSIGLVKYYEKTIQAMLNSNLNPTTFNKALQKACESYRITSEQKEILRKLKVKR